MKSKLLALFLFGFLLIWSSLSYPKSCSSEINISSQNNSVAIPNYSNAWYTPTFNSKCLGIEQFPLSSCFPDSSNTAKSTPGYQSSSALASDPVGQRIFQATFRISDWSGQLLAYQANSTTGSLDSNNDGVVNASDALWDGGKALTTQDQTQVCSGIKNPTAKSTSIPLSYSYYFGPFINFTSPQGTLFEYQNFSNAQDSPLDPNDVQDPVFKYYSGCQQDESSFRTRVVNSNDASKFAPLLGDLINSTPAFVGSEDFNYYNLDGGVSKSEGITYAAFVQAKSTPAIGSSGSTNPRPRMVYVGGNDGILHGFEAGVWGTNNSFTNGSGTELLSFIPSASANSNLALRANQFPSYFNNNTDPSFNTNNPSFNTNNPLFHRYLVDGSPTVGDAYFQPANALSTGSSTSWHTVLLGTTGASPGDRLWLSSGSVFALDVTNPTVPSETCYMNDNTVLPCNVLWEFTSILGSYTPGSDADLGITLSQPSLARMQNGAWAAIVGNGYNSTNQIPVLYILDISKTPNQTGFIIAKFSPCVTSANIQPPFNSAPPQIDSSKCPGPINGLSTPIAVDVNFDRKVDYIYAGDLQGNLWKFDVNCAVMSSCTPSSDWKVSNGGNPLFTACDTTTTPCGVTDRQPITAKPQVGSVSTTQANAVIAENRAQGRSSNTNQPSVMVYFGTGSYLGLCDVGSPTYQVFDTTSNAYTGPPIACPSQQQFSQQQTLYALWDKNNGTTIPGRNSLLAQSILNPSSITQTDTKKTSVTNVRVTSSQPSNLPNYTYSGTLCSAQPTGTPPQIACQELGWYMDLSAPTSQNPSERSTKYPLLINGNIVFTTFTPASNPCQSQPVSWLMELNAITGNPPTTPSFLNLFGTNPKFTSPSNDLVTVTTGTGSGKNMAPSGVQSTVGILTTPALIYNKGVINKYSGGSTAGIQMLTDPGTPKGRVSWRQLR